MPAKGVRCSRIRSTMEVTTWSDRLCPAGCNVSLRGGTGTKLAKSVEPACAYTQKYDINSSRSISEGMSKRTCHTFAPNFHLIAVPSPTKYSRVLRSEVTLKLSRKRPSGSPARRTFPKEDLVYRLAHVSDQYSGGSSRYTESSQHFSKSPVVIQSVKHSLQLRNDRTVLSGATPHGCHRTARDPDVHAHAYVVQGMLYSQAVLV